MILQTKRVIWPYKTSVIFTEETMQIYHMVDFSITIMIRLYIYVIYSKIGGNTKKKLQPQYKLFFLFRVDLNWKKTSVQATSYYFAYLPHFIYK